MPVTKDESAPSEPVSALARELAQRQSGGVEVLLLWQPKLDRVEVCVRDSKTGAEFQMEVAPADAIEAFYHPYAYAAMLETSDGVRDKAAMVDG